MHANQPHPQGGKVNARTTEDVVSVVSIGGQELLHYRPPRRVDVALLRGTTADTDGNVSLEREALLVDQLNQALAVKNSGGTVIVQVERVVERHTIPSRAVHLPGVLVDAVVVAPAEHAPQSYVGPDYDGALSGEVRAPLHALGRLPMDERKVIAHRAFFELDHARCLVNLGVGIPEGVAMLKATHARQNPHASTATLTTEAGVFGGVPAGGLRFGSGYNSEALVPTATMIDLYSGGGCDLAVLGMAQVDAAGNVNVHSFGSRAPGCGGFIDISQNSKKCVFTGTFTSGGLKVDVADGKLRILREGANRKFVAAVPEKTFAAARCEPGKNIFYVTERAVFKLIRASAAVGCCAAGCFGRREGGEGWRRGMEAQDPDPHDEGGPSGGHDPTSRGLSILLERSQPPIPPLSPTSNHQPTAMQLAAGWS